MRATRTDAADRKKQILEAGAKLAAKHGHKNVTRRMVAIAAKVSEPLVSSYVGSTKGAQLLYKRQAKKMGLVEPDAARAERIGIKLRQIGPQAPRQRSIREIRAIKDKLA